MTTAEGTVGGWLRWLLAALSTAAGVIHLAMVGEHFDVTWAHGTFFAVVGWGQLALGAALALRPDRRVLAGSAALGAGVVGVWAVSRLWGVPVGPHAGTPEPVGLADALSTGFELVIVVVAAAVLSRPALAQRPLATAVARRGLVGGGVVIAVASTLALSPAFASGDHHGDAAGAAGGGGHDHADGHTAAEGAAGGRGDHTAAEAPAGGRGGHTAAVIQADGTSACEQAGVANEGNSGGHGHRGPVPFTPLDADVREVYADQVAAANAVVAALPTVADAEAAGYRRVSPYVPCIAAHYVKTSALMEDGFRPETPEVVRYAGTDPDSEVVGLSYLTMSEDAPEGFAGHNDPWHVHEKLCLGDGGVLGIETATEEDCAARGGRMVDVGNIWMTHMWNVPGWESRWGLFSSEHPDLGGRVGDIDAPPDPEADDAWFDERPIGAG